MTDLSEFPVEIWKLSDIKPYDKNAKKHSPEQIDQLSHSIRRFGWTQPIVVDVDGVIIAGHGRRLAAMKLGFKKVPVVCRKDLSKEKADILRIADNKVSSNLYDQGMLLEEMRRISETLEDGLDEFKNLGFSEIDLRFADEDIISQFDESVFEENITEAVEKQKEEINDRSKNIDSDKTPFSAAFGISKITVGESRKIKAFMNAIEAKYDKSGIGALIDHIDNSGVLHD
jgi:hypothetical protein